MRHTSPIPTSASVSAMSTPSITWLALPQEVVEQSLINCEVEDVASAAQTCHRAHNIVYGSDNHIWRGLFLRLFDDPRTAPTTGATCTPFDWRTELQRRIVARNVLLSREYGPSGKGVLRQQRVDALETAVNLILAALPGANCTENTRSRDLEWIEDILGHIDLDVGYNLYSVITPIHPDERFAIDYERQQKRASLGLRTLFAADGTGVDHFNNHSLQPTIEEDAYDEERARRQSLARERMLRARLRLLRGYNDDQKAVIEGYSDLGRTRSEMDLRLYARSRVYDLGRYTNENSYGPLLKDGSGRVDWEQVEAILVDATMNIFDHIMHDAHNCPRVINPFGFRSAKAYTAPGCNSLPEGDWAGITGKWNRLISFCDYRDLRQYNDMLSSTWNRRPASLFAEQTFSEAVHVLTVPLRVSAIGSPANPTAFPDRPTLTIEGEMVYNGDQTSKLKGKVYMTPDGAIRWDFTSSMDGQMRWSSLGIQVGEAGSASGILGIWTGIDHEPQDPAGPFWFWKIE